MAATRVKPNGEDEEMRAPGGDDGSKPVHVTLIRPVAFDWVHVGGGGTGALMVKVMDETPILQKKYEFIMTDGGSLGTTVMETVQVHSGAHL